MSGIYGIINLDRHLVDPGNLQKMEHHLKHRGPEGQTRHVEEHIAVGHALMCISPESSFEKQPLIHKQWILLLDGRLFNRVSLLKALNLQVSDHTTTPDSRLVIWAYEKWGEACPKHLEGEFAFVIIDKVRNEIFCAKDHFGNRSLFYHFDKNQFSFASEIKTLCLLNHIPKDINYEWLLSIGVNPFGISRDSTSFKAIRSVPKAHSLTVNHNGEKLVCYWEPELNSSDSIKSDEYYIEAFQETVKTALEKRMRSDYPISIALSGGLDSSMLACYAARSLAPQNRTLFASGYQAPVERQGSIGDEMPYIEAILQQEKNIQFDVVRIQPSGPDEIQMLSSKFGFPQRFSMRPWNEVYKNLQENKARVMLTGFLGDDVVSRKGMEIPALLFKQRQWRSLWRLLKMQRDVKNRSLFRLAFSCLSRFSIDSFKNSVGLQNENKLLSSNPMFRLLHPAVKQKVQETIRENGVFKKYRTYTSIDEKLYFLLTNGLDLANDSMAIPAHHHQVLFTTPLADLQVVQFAMSLPLEKWMINGQSRGLIRAATHNLLPELVRTRSTKGFLNLEQDIYTENQLNQYVEYAQHLDEHPVFSVIDKDKTLQFISSYHQEKSLHRMLLIDQIMNVLFFEQKHSI